MQKVGRQILMEVLWLTVSLGITILIISMLFRWSFTNETIDIHLYENIYLVNKWHILIPLFLLVTFLIYFIKEFRTSFRRNLANTLLVIVGSTLIVSITILTRAISQSFITGWTIYPPLSALGPGDPVVAHDPATKAILNILIIVQILILLMLLIVAYSWGSKKVTRKYLGDS